MKRPNLILLLSILIITAAAGWYFSSIDLTPLQFAWRIAATVFLLNLLLIAVVILMEKRNPYKTIAWLLIFIVFPIGGYILYTFFGRNIRKDRVYKNLTHYDRCSGILEANCAKAQECSVPQTFVPGTALPCPKLSRLISGTTALPVQRRNNIRVLTNGPSTFREIIKALKRAQHHIHMEYYIIRDDKLGRKIREVLIDKAKEGIKIRILYDGVGCLKLPEEFFRPLKEAGGEIAVFMPLRFPFLDYRSNYRNHRKILVVDGRVGFLGGLNIGDEYLGKSKNLGFWRDTHIKLEGDSVYSMQAIFLQDWTFATGKRPDCRGLFPAHGIETQRPVQIIASSPASEWDAMQKLYVQLVSMAQTKLYITTPYLIPDESLITVLKISALGGIDVRLLVPGIPDKRIVHWASRSYYQELMDAGVKVYEYNRGFIHAKVVQVDNSVASVGTANLDIRSLHLGYEVNAIVYDQEVIKTLESDFFRDLKYSVGIDKTEWKNRSLRKNLAESTARLFSPLL